jgi:hypothetical protein
MPDPSEISQITTTDGVTHDIKDATARTTKVNKSGDTMTGQLVAQNNVAYTTAQVRNIILSTSEPTSTDGANGDIWIVYKE